MRIILDYNEVGILHKIFKFAEELTAEKVISDVAMGCAIELGGRSGGWIVLYDVKDSGLLHKIAKRHDFELVNGGNEPFKYKTSW